MNAVAVGWGGCEDRRVRMHAGQVEVSVDVVAALVAAQFPRWRAWPVRAVVSHGTVNALFRLGDEVVLRFPLRPSADPVFRAELVAVQENARRIAGCVPLPVAEPLAVGEPGAGYPGLWSAYRWLAGDTAELDTMGDPGVFAVDLAGFVGALRAMDTGGRVWDGRSRGGPLAGRDAGVRRDLAACAHLVDAGRLAAVWRDCLDAPVHGGADVWLHADLMPGNLLVRGGRLAAVIDLDAVAVGDPAVDLMPAWNLLPAGAREQYRRAVGVDYALWWGCRGWALLPAGGASG